ncbi:DUF924 domain-containing protein [Chitiniphilus purpureus]|uniref:DUF924 domain-containing protein n=1 Tax=Chitiniphilus purpureus TaxID=2981137 RepID=A0ABY6DRQ6_9NEIS|nr:DUF924 family protein [Chitiniphilus sp. CD1]UXY16908.1 DUF924 domain-containing protein [Chitiniphilus sp. CD1]
MSDLIRRSSPEGRVKSGREGRVAEPAQVLAFWFDTPQAQATLWRSVWFERDDAFDAGIRQRFSATLEAALAGSLDHWARSAAGALALVIVLDQFPRNLFRGEARAFAGDAAARRIATSLLAQGWQRELTAVQQMFAYLPFEHAECLADQDRSVALTARWRDDPQLATCYDYALRHREVIRRFGRFPHRNAVLGRHSTERERAWLDAHGGF